MIYSGADLIRTSGQQHERAERLTKGVEAVADSGTAGTALDQDTQGALLRFARFVHKESLEKKKDKPKLKHDIGRILKAVAANPYVAFLDKAEGRHDVGQMLDLYA
jgi:hypothetical protein